MAQQFSSAERMPRLRVARGPKRPIYLGDPDLDRLMMMLTALTGEVSALRDRLDTHERLALEGKPASAAAIDAFEVSSEIADDRARVREAMLSRVYRVLFEELEAAHRRPALNDAIEPEETG